MLELLELLGGVDEPLLEDPPDELPLSELVLLVVVLVVDAVLEALVLALVDDPLEDEDDDELASDFLFDPPEYRSEYQPPPLRMKLPEVIWRLARGCEQFGQSFNGSSVMRCTRSNSWPQASQR